MSVAQASLVGMLAGFLAYWALSIILQKATAFRSRLENDKASARERQHTEHKERQLRDKQLNHGRMIYNWLRSELNQYEEVGIKVYKIEDNGGAFSIHIQGPMVGSNPTPILQLSYDFVRYPSPWYAHIHYGAYGSDILLLTADHAPKHGLHHFVLKPVREAAERISRRSAEV